MTALTIRLALYEEALEEARRLMAQADEALTRAGVSPVLQRDLRDAVERFGELIDNDSELSSGRGSHS